MIQDKREIKTNNPLDNQPERMTWATPTVQDLHIGKTASGNFNLPIEATFTPYRPS